MRKLLCFMLAATLLLGGCNRLQNTNPVFNDEDDSLGQAIKLVNSEDIVYIDGISAEDAKMIDALLRYVEDTSKITDADLAQQFDQIAPKIAQWFDPNFDVVDVFRDANCELRNETTNSLVFSENAKEELYFVEFDGQTGIYSMSSGYYLLGYYYSGIEQAIIEMTAVG